MEILGTTQYVDLKSQKEPWLQLSVINQWDWNTKAISFELIGNTRVSYCLKLNTPKTHDSYHSKIIEKLTDEMKKAIMDKGLILLNGL